MARFSDYPHRPTLDGKPEVLLGIHKCQAFADPEMRWIVFQVQCRLAGVPIERDGTEPKSQLEREAAQREPA
jgi:hypothetical protein